MRKLLAAALCLVVFFSLVITGSISYSTACAESQNAIYMIAHDNPLIAECQFPVIDPVLLVFSQRK